MAGASVRVLGLDMGFENTGWATACFNDGWVLAGCGLIVTKPIKKKLGIYKSDDDMRRAEHIAAILRGLVHEDAPHVVAFESRTNVRSAAVSAKLGMSYGVLATVIQIFGLAKCSLNPQDVKCILAGSQKATKADIEEIVKIRVDGSELAEQTTRSRRHHVYDAIAAALASEQSDVFRAAVAGVKRE